MDEFGGKVRNPLYFSLSPAILNDNAFPLHVSELAQSLPEDSDARRRGRRGSGIQVSYPRNFCWLLRPQGTSKQQNSKQEANKNLALYFCLLPFYFCLHLITLSARANTVGGIVRAICLAALRLMMNSNFLGCSTGRSPGFLPFRIL